jgi:ABC-type siderophore export system fused ATPase/permease subunit
LPGLKARGKTVLVISHDDRYYHIADRIIKLEYGKIVYDKSALFVEPSSMNAVKGSVEFPADVDSREL